MVDALRFQIGGTVPTEGYVYVARPEESALLSYLREGRWCNVVGCRTMGKSSLVQRCLKFLEQDHSVAYVDIAGHIGLDVETRADWVHALGKQIFRDLRRSTGQPGHPSRKASALPTCLQNLFADVLGAVPGNLVLVLDEIDTLSALKYREGLLAELRTFQTEQALHPEMQRLVLCQVGLRPFYEHGNTRFGTASPLGSSIRVEDFSPSEMTVNAILEGFPARQRPSRDVITRILEETGGQPYLTIFLADRARTEGVRSLTQWRAILASFESEQRRRPMELFDLIQRFLITHGTEAFSALSAYRDLLHGRLPEDMWQSPGLPLLLLSGLVRTGDNGPEIKCPLFRRHFDEAWVNYQIAEIGVRHRPRFAEKGRKKICVLNTGGTIGMFRQPDGTVGPPKTEEEFIERYRQIEDLADITFIPLFGLDSVNIYPPEWAEIARAIFDRRDAGYEGFVVAHGTDTMAFTASAVAFALGPNLRFPVVFTGAQTTADVPHGDAASNLYRACMTALEPIPEVVIAFAEYVFRAVRAQKKNEERFDAFESPNYPALAYIGETIDLRRDFVRQLPPTLQPIELRASFQEGAVLMLNQYPGLDPKFFLYILKLESEGKGPRCRGIVVQTQGAGNVSSRLPFSYVRVLEEAQRMGIPVLIASQFPTKRGTDVRFQTASWALKLDAIPVGHMTVAAAITKFHWVLGQLADATPRRGPEAAAHIEEVRRMMHRNYVGEIDIEEERR